jgi:hypothetical protein
MEMLMDERALAMSRSLDKSTHRSYSSALNSWIAFVNMHQFEFEPTADSLSFFVVYMSHQISPRSVKSYLSGLVSQLERDFPNVSQLRKSRLVTKTLQGCLKMLAKPIKRKDPLSIKDLVYLQKRYHRSTNHDDLLFFTLLATGLHGLLRLGDLTFPDDPSKREWRKVTRRSSLVLRQSSYSFMLNAHKADKTYEGNTVLIQAFEIFFDPFPFFLRYLSSRDRLFPASSPLWLTSAGQVPTRSFFMSRFRVFFSKSYGGTSMRAGGATYLATLGTSSSIIRAMGRWKSEAWEIYIRMHPTLLRALLQQRSR